MLELLRIRTHDSLRVALVTAMNAMAPKGRPVYACARTITQDGWNESFMRHLPVSRVAWRVRVCTFDNT